MTTKHKQQDSVVDVTFIDGEVKSFIMTASNAIASYLMEEAARTGVLIMRDDRSKRSVCIPLAQVRHVEIQTINPEGVVAP